MGIQGWFAGSVLYKCSYSCSPRPSLSCPYREETESQVVKQSALLAAAALIAVALPITLCRWDINGWVQTTCNGHFLCQVFHQCHFVLNLSLIEPARLGAILPVLRVRQGGTEPSPAVYMVKAWCCKFWQHIRSHWFSFVQGVPVGTGRACILVVRNCLIFHVDKCYREKEGVGRWLKAFILRVIWADMVGWILLKNDRACVFYKGFWGVRNVRDEGFGEER